MKRLLALFMAMAMVFSVTAPTVFAAEETTLGPIVTATLNTDSELVNPGEGNEEEVPATPTPEPEEEPEADPEPMPDITAAPTAAPTATPTAEPTATPTAEPTATPTVEPTATPTAEPTATPTPTPTPVPDMTRAAWVQQLVATFAMTVEEDNYPDNYYSDISVEDDFYRDILVAVNFGVIDLEAGQPFRPLEPATRAFAAQTLYFCLGFQPEEGTSYTFSDVDAVADPDTAQTALDRGWFAPVDGAFCPDAWLTAAEVSAMLADAEALLAEQVIDEDAESHIAFVDGIINVPEGTEVSVGEDDVVITDCPVDLQVGDRFAIWRIGLPTVYQAEAITQQDNQLFITTSRVSTAESFTAFSSEGIADLDLGTIEVGEDATITYTLLETGESFSTLESYNAAVDALDGSLNLDTAITINETIPWENYSISASVTLKDLKLHYDLALDEVAAWITCYADYSISITAGTDLGDDDLLGGEDGITDIPLFSAPVLGVLNVSVGIEIDVQGEASIHCSGPMTGGFVQKIFHAPRILRNFSSRHFSLQAQFTGLVGARISFGLISLPILEDAEIFASMGAQLTYSIQEHFEEGTEGLTCHDLAAFLYFRLGLEIAVDMGAWAGTFAPTLDIFTADNSPARATAHWENGARVQTCTYDSSHYVTADTSRLYDTGTGRLVAKTDDNGNLVGEGYLFTLLEDGTACLKQYTGSGTSLPLPSSVNGIPVSTIAADAFMNNTTLAYVNIPSTVTTIGARAFYGCEALTTVQMANNVTTMGLHAFRGCTALTDISLSDKLTAIPDYAFYECASLQRVTLPAAATSIGYRSFYYCTNLKSVNTSSNTVLTSVGSYSFQGCDSLLHIMLPASVITINTGAFYDCPSLAIVDLAGSEITLGEKIFYGCTQLSALHLPYTTSSLTKAFSGSSLKELTFKQGWGEIGSQECYNMDTLRVVRFEDGLTTIGYEAFYGCDNLRKVVMPNSVMSLGNSAFANCPKLTDVTMPPDLTAIPAGLFSGCTSLAQLDMPDLILTIGDRAFAGTALENLELTTYMTEIGDNILENNTGTSTITIPLNLSGSVAGSLVGSSVKTVTFADGYTKIPVGALKGVTSVETVNIPESVTEILSNAFYGCTSLKNIILPSSLTYIPTDCFGKCTSLDTVNIPAGVTSIYYNAFQGSGISHITLPEGLTTIHRFAFSQTPNLTELTIPSTVTTMAETLNDGKVYMYSCLEDSGVKKLIFAEGTTRVPQYAAQYAYALEEIVLPQSLTGINSQAFSGCSSLKTVVFPDTMTYIGMYTFQNCTALEEIILPAAMTSLTDRAFYQCTGLKSITLPANMQEIGAWAFRGAAIEGIHLPETLTTLNTGVFADCVNLKQVDLPDGLTVVAGSLFSGCTSLAEAPLHEGITEIGASAFANTALTEFVIPETVTQLGGRVLDGNTGVTQVVVPNGVRYMTHDDGTEGAFRGSSITRIEFLEGRTALPAYAMDGMSALTEIILPDTLTSVDKAAFRDCILLTKNPLSDQITSYPDYLFDGCIALTDAAIPDTVTRLGSYCYQGCTALTQIHLPDSITSISRCCLANTGLTSLTLPKYLQTLGGQVLSGTTGVTELLIPKTVTTAYTYTSAGSSYYGALRESSVQKLTFEDGTTQVPAHICRGALSLTEVNFPDTVTAIGSHAFYGAHLPAELRLPYRCSYVAPYGLYSATYNCKALYLPMCMTSIDSNAFHTGYLSTIYGFAGSYAETWAAAKSLTFVDITADYMGDLNGSGRITIGDALALANGIAGKYSLTTPQINLANLDTTTDPEDGTKMIDVLDLILQLNRITGKTA